MSPDEQENQTESERQRFLEEVRRRAEAAELKRLEEEENQPASSAPPAPATEQPAAAAPEPEQPPAPAPFPVPPPHQHEAPEKIVDTQKLMVLRERLLIAIDRGRTARAAQILADLTSLNPDNPELEDLRERVAAMARDRQAEEQAAAPAVYRPATERAPRPQGRPEDVRKKIAERLETANSFYQQEKYEKGLESIEEVFALDPGNEEAVALREQIVKAQRLAEQIRQEDARRRDAARREAPPKPVETQPVPTESTEVWGTTLVTPADTGYELAPEEKGPALPPKPPFLHRAGEKLLRLRVILKPLLTIATVVAVIAIGIVVYNHLRTSVAPSKSSIAVLPMMSTVGDSGSVLLAAGISDDLINDLGEVGDLRVVAPATMYGFRNSPLNGRQIAQMVAANYYLQSSLGGEPGSYTMQVSLYDTASLTSVWSSKYQSSARQFSSLQKEITRSIARALNLTISGPGNATLDHAGTSSPEAYDDYIRARALLRRGGSASCLAAIDLLRHAVGSDTGFADGESALAWAEILAYESDGGSSAGLLEQALESVQRAFVLGSRSSEAYRAWGMVERYRKDLALARDRLEQAVKVSPSDAEAQRRLAIVDILRRDPEAALKSAHRAAADDPGNFDSFLLLGNIQQFMGQFQDAFLSYEQALRISPDRSAFACGLYADVLVYIQQPDRAIALLQDRVARVRDSYLDFYKLGRIGQSAGIPKQEWMSALRKADDILNTLLRDRPEDARALAMKALVLTRLGQFRESDSACARALRLAPDDAVVMYRTARMYALHRDKEHAIAYLAKAVDKHFEFSSVLDMDFFNLRTEPEFVNSISR